MIFFHLLDETLEFHNFCKLCYLVTSLIRIHNLQFLLLRRESAWNLEVDSHPYLVNLFVVFSFLPIPTLFSLGSVPTLFSLGNDHGFIM